MVGLFCLLVNASAQNADKSGKPVFEVKLIKQTYLRLEPIYLLIRHKAVAPGGEPGQADISALVTYQGLQKRFDSLTVYVVSGAPQPVPTSPGFASVFVLDPSGNNPKRRPPKLVMQTREIVIERVDEFFPSYGEYQIRFIFDGAKPNVFSVTIKPPTGIDLAAYEQLSKFKSPLSFYWVWEDKDGVSILESFVNKFGRSVYGEYATLYLAQIYLARGQNDQAKTEFLKIKDSIHVSVAKDAREALAEIERRQTADRK